MAPTPRTPSPHDLQEAFKIFESRLLSSFAVLGWDTEMVPRLVKAEANASHMVIVQNAVVLGTLVSIRAVDDFFMNPEAVRFDHDIIADDFGFTELGTVLGEEERSRINQMIIHMSYNPMWNSARYSGPNGDKSFDSSQLLAKLVPRAISFLNFLPESKICPCGGEILDRLAALNTIVPQMFERLQRTASEQRERSSRQANSVSD